MKKYSGLKMFQGIGSAITCVTAIEGVGAMFGYGTTVIGGITIGATGGVILLGASAAFLTYVCIFGEKDGEGK